ncbi:MAG TPA: sugar transferase [Deltaproteobacteria bacterium]|nr:sugar transferase [Deltaproteobacteria bacterium]
MQIPHFLKKIFQPAESGMGLLDELYERYGRHDGGNGFAQRFRLWRKKTAWVTAVSGARILKRLVDIAAAVWLFIILSPLLAMVAAAIKLTDNGPVLYWQTRVGKWGREFRFPKFRSMRVSSDRERQELLARSHHKDSITFKMKNDPRVTWIGRIIRRTSIDELPQLWNVLKGEMSLVGPRPPLPEEVDRYTLRDRRRLDVTPGLTCIWQVSGRGDVPFPKQLEYDVQYIESQSLLLDIVLLLKTVGAVLTGRGAY